MRSSATVTAAEARAGYPSWRGPGGRQVGSRSVGGGSSGQGKLALALAQEGLHVPEAGGE